MGRFVRREADGQVFVWTETLAKKPGFVVVDDEGEAKKEVATPIVATEELNPVQKILGIAPEEYYVPPMPDEWKLSTPTLEELLGKEENDELDKEFADVEGAVDVFGATCDTTKDKPVEPEPPESTPVHPEAELVPMPEEPEYLTEKDLMGFTRPELMRYAKKEYGKTFAVTDNRDAMMTWLTAKKKELGQCDDGRFALFV